VGVKFQVGDKVLLKKKCLGTVLEDSLPINRNQVIKLVKNSSVIKEISPLSGKILVNGLWFYPRELIKVQTKSDSEIEWV
jgi:hypothetical protein